MDALPIPPAWLDVAQQWAPHVLAALVITTVLAHVLLPVARRVSLWAAASPATWDDGPAKRAVEILEWLVSATEAILAWLPRLAIGGLASRLSPSKMSQRPSPSACKGCGQRRTLVDEQVGGTLCMRCRELGPPRPPDAGAGLALALVIIAAALSAAVSGCSTGPQLPVTATPQNTSCNYTITIGAIPSDDASIVAPSGTDGTAGVIVSDNDCSIDRIAASADPTTVGNEIGPVEVSPDTDVGGLPGST